MEAFDYGRSLYREVPVFGWVADAVLPMVTAFHSMPYASLIYFLTLAAFVVNADGMPHFVKFNIQQALFLDMIVLLPLLFLDLFPEAQQLCVALGPSLPVFLCNMMWYTCLVVCGYAVVSNARGDLPDRVPGLSQAAGLYLSWLQG